MIRPKLDRIGLEEAFKIIWSGRPSFIFTISVGQWNKFLEEAYFNQNATLIELDSSENPVAAYKKPFKRDEEEVNGK